MGPSVTSRVLVSGLLSVKLRLLLPQPGLWIPSVKPFLPLTGSQVSSVCYVGLAALGTQIQGLSHVG